MIQRMFGMSFRLDSERAVTARIHARLAFRNEGRIETNHPGCDPDAAMRLHYLVTEDVVQRGDALQKYLNVREVEDLLRRYLPGADFARIEAAMSDSADKEASEVAKKLIDLLTCQSICFGDGPRYPVDDVVRVTAAVLNELRQENVMGPYQAPFDIG